jgi:hypothetical protein
MGMKPPIWEPFGPVTNAVTSPKKTDHYAQVQNAVTSTRATGNPEPVNTGHGTVVSGPVAGARGPVARGSYGGGRR